MSQPVRIQRKRSKGWRMPENAVYVGRPTKFGNPFLVALEGSAQRVVEQYRFWIRGAVTAEIFALYGFPPQAQEVHQLRGKDLACWCRLDQPCHADVLLEIANS